MSNSNTDQRAIVYLPEIAACLPFASTDQTRMYLTGLFLTWRGDVTACVATDGHKLCLATTTRQNIDSVADVFGGAPEQHDGVILQASDAKGLTRWISRNPSIIAENFAKLEIEGRQLTFTSFDGKRVIQCEAIDAAYPDYERVIPADDKKLCLDSPIAFNAKFLADIQKAAKAGFSHRKALACKAHFYGPADPAVFTMSNPDGDSAKIVLMPMRV